MTVRALTLHTKKAGSPMSTPTASAPKSAGSTAVASRIPDRASRSSFASGEHDLAEHVPGSHLVKSSTRIGQGERRVDHRRNPLVDNEARQTLELGPVPHRGPDDTQLLEEDLGQLGLGRRI